LKKSQKISPFLRNYFLKFVVFKIVFVLKSGKELILELYNVFNLKTYFLFAKGFKSLNFLVAGNFLFKKSKYFKFC